MTAMARKRTEIADVRYWELDSDAWKMMQGKPGSLSLRRRSSGVSVVLLL
jgi:hypothetical protein